MGVEIKSRSFWRPSSVEDFKLVLRVRYVNHFFVFSAGNVEEVAAPMTCDSGKATFIIPSGMSIVATRGYYVDPLQPRIPSFNDALGPLETLRYWSVT